jgi:addiction module HigA family antidote
MTADTALRLARYFGTSAGFWMGLQDDYELEEARRKLGSDLDKISGITA